MLRLRRTLAFSARIHNYLILLYLFSLGLYFSRLWWYLSPDFERLVMSLNTSLAVVCLWYALVLLAISLFLWLVDNIFPAWDFWTTILRSTAVLVGQVLVALLEGLTAGTFRLYF